MLDTESFTEVVKGFVELYRVGIKVFDDRGGKLADIKIGNGDFCGYVFSFPEGRRRCTATVGRVKTVLIGRSTPKSSRMLCLGLVKANAVPLGSPFTSNSGPLA